MLNKNSILKCRRHFFVLGIFLLFLVSCTKKEIENPPAETGPTPSTEPSVETLPKVAPDQKPYFVAQTRVGAVHTTTAITVTLVTNQLSKPWDIAFLPDGRMMVTEKTGTIRIITTSGVIGPPISGVPAVKYQSDSGLFSIVLDPDFATTRHVFWSFVEPVSDGYVTSIARAALSVDEKKFEDLKIIYRAYPSYTGVQHKGCRIIFDRDKNLYASFGDHFDAGIRLQTQTLTASIGKIVRITRDGAAAAGNPINNRKDALPEIWSVGHRDPQGLAFSPVSGELWGSDHGPTGGDEINVIKPGKNYGWPFVSYGVDNVSPNIGMPIGLGTQLEGTEQPIYYWDPSVAVSGMSFYSGTQIPEWKNNLFVASLVAKHLIRLVIYNNKVIGEERLLVNLNRRIRMVKEGPDGVLYVATDDIPGAIYSIKKTPN